MTRQEANIKILSKLTEEVYKNPDIRFCQLLCIYGLPYKDDTNGDLFYEESVDTLSKLNSKLNEYYRRTCN